MKKLGIGAVVGGIILFLWQFLSWSVLNIHSSMQAYTPKQDEVLKALNENLEEGFYYMPNTPPGQEHENPMEAYVGKPWAQVYYHKVYNASMGANMGRGLFVDIIAVLLLAWLLLKMNNTNFQSILLSSLAVGMIGYLTTVYTNSIWFQTHTMGDLIDSIVSWGLVGAWLGWWLKR